MPPSFTAPRRVAAPLLIATASLSLLALHCSDDEVGQPTGGAGNTTQPSSGSGGTASQGGSSSGMASGGVPTAGTSQGGAGAAGAAGVASGAGTAGTAPGTGGTGGTANGGSGGTASGGSAGSSGSGGGGGGSSVTFAQVKDLLSKSCAGGKCHDAASPHIDWITGEGLYQRLTTPLPAGTPHCVGDTPVVPGMPGMSLLVKVITGPGKISCSKSGGGTEMIARMPDDCSTTSANPRACLTDTQIKLVTDWISGGAPQ